MQKVVGSSPIIRSSKPAGNGGFLLLGGARFRACTLGGNGEGNGVIFYGVVDDNLEEAIELFTNRREAERVVERWDRDEPDRAGELDVEPVELETSPN